MKILKMRDRRLYAFLDVVFNIFKKNKDNVNQLIVFRNSICFFSGEYAGKYDGEYPNSDFKMLENGVYSLAKAPDGSLEFQYSKDEVFSPEYFNEKIQSLHTSDMASCNICEIDGLDEYVASRITASSGIWIKDSDVKLFSKLYRPYAKYFETGFLIADHDDYGYHALIRIIYTDSNLYQNTQTSLNDYDYDDETGEVISTDEEPVEDEAPQVEEQSQPNEEEQHQEPQQLNLDDLDELDVEPTQEEGDDPWEIPAMDF